MRYLFSLLLLVWLANGAASAQKLSIGQWYAHLPHNNARQVIEVGDEIYTVTNVYYFSYDKNTGDIERFDKVWGLSDVQVDRLAYAPQSDAVIVAYHNTNIDLIKGGNTIVNVSDILRKSVSGIKEIKEITIAGSLAYFATTFGIVVFDIEEEEFRDTYIIGDNGDQVNVSDVALTADSIYALTSEGLKKAPLSGANLANYQNWVTIGPANGLPVANGSQIEILGDTLFAVFADSVFKGVNGQWTIYYNDMDYAINGIKATNGKLFILESDTLPKGRITHNVGGTWQYITNDALNVPNDIIEETNGIIWVSDLYRGLIKIAADGTVQEIRPNALGSLGTTGISYNSGTLWVAPGGVDQNWNPRFNNDGFYSLQDGFWGHYTAYTIPQLQQVYNINAVAASPVTGKVYFGSFGSGLLEWDGTTLTKYDKDNSSLQGATGDPNSTRVSGIAIDDAGNVWIANYGAASPFHVLTTAGNTVRLNTPSIYVGSVSKIVVDDFNRKWMLLPQSTTQGILVYDHGTDVENTGDDQYKVLTTQTGNGGLPTNEVISIANDKTGQIWVGTTQGIAVFYCPGSVFSQGCDAQRIIVSRGGFNGYLLENERISEILVDGANRKWVGTSNGLWVFSPDGTEELAYFNEENSPLLSDNILALGYDGNMGIMYISTDQGLMALRTEATEGTTTYADPIEVFPNPVKETYNGPIAIKGLPSNAEVHITDVTGMLIYQTQAYGGQAVWDGHDYTGRKAKTGVYLVFSVNEDGTESKPTKLLLIK